MDYKVFTNALSEKKGEDIKVLKIDEICSFADYFIIASGKNVNQIQAMADAVQEDAAKSGYEQKMIEGYEKANWILMDYGDIIVHIFDHESRSFYNLERLWNDAQVMEE